MLNVYRSGFASTQEAYESAVNDVFSALDRIEGILANKRYLTGNRLTEADIRLFTTLIRFDPVYVSHFKVVLLYGFASPWDTTYLTIYGIDVARSRSVYSVPCLGPSARRIHFSLRNVTYIDGHSFRRLLHVHIHCI
jgi:hypothetical protein